MKKRRIGSESESGFWNALVMYLVDVAHLAFRALLALCFDFLLETLWMRWNRWNFALLERCFAAMLYKADEKSVLHAIEARIGGLNPYFVAIFFSAPPAL